MASGCILVFVLSASVFCGALAFDPSPLQDICVADYHSPVFVNGYACKDPKDATVEDFVQRSKPLDPPNYYGLSVKSTSVKEVPGLNTLGVSGDFVQFAPGAVVPPLYQSRATALVTCLTGNLYFGFVLNIKGRPRTFAKILHKFDTMVIPIGLIRFALNVGNTPASIFAGYNSQLAGTNYAIETIFGPKHPIDDKVIAKGFRITTEDVDRLRDRFDHY